MGFGRISNRLVVFGKIVKKYVEQCNKQFLLLHNVLQHKFNLNIKSTILV